MTNVVDSIDVFRLVLLAAEAAHLVPRVASVAAPPCEMSTACGSVLFRPHIFVEILTSPLLGLALLVSR